MGGTGKKLRIIVPGAAIFFACIAFWNIHADEAEKKAAAEPACAVSLSYG